MARRSDNVFHPMTYEGVVDLESETSLERRISLQAQIAEFGQTPRQLFNQAHPYYRGASIPVHVPPKRHTVHKAQEGEDSSVCQGESASAELAQTEVSSAEDSKENSPSKTAETSVSTAGAMHLKSFSRWWTPVSLCGEDRPLPEKAVPKKRGSPSRSKGASEDTENKLPPLELNSPVQETNMVWPVIHRGRLMSIAFLKGLQSLGGGVIDRSVACTIGEDGMLCLLDVSSELAKECSNTTDYHESMGQRIQKRQDDTIEHPDISDLVSDDEGDGAAIYRDRFLHCECISNCCLYCQTRIPTCRLDTLSLLCPPNAQSPRQSLVQQHETMAVGDGNGSLHFFDAVSRRKTSSFQNLHTGRIACVDSAVISFSVGKSSMPIPLLLATGGADGLLKVFPITRTGCSNGSVEIHDCSTKSGGKPSLSLPDAQSPITAVVFCPPETESPLSTEVPVQSIPQLLYREHRSLPENVDPSSNVNSLGVYGTARGAVVWFDPFRSTEHVVATSTSLVQPVPDGLSVANGNVGITSIKWAGTNGRVVAASGSGRIGIFSEQGICSGILTTGDVPRALDLPQPIHSSRQGTEETSAESCVFDGPMQHSTVCSVGSSSCARFWDIRNLWSEVTIAQSASSRRPSKSSSKPFQMLCSSDCELYNIACQELVLDLSGQLGQNTKRENKFRLDQQPIENWSTCIALENRNRVLAVGTENGRICVWFKKFN
eukprot:gb/GECG01012632.1/.p1 GENE.gb/GECG01012632.1/~~gb/GECG01012632.1/.p1  ORF type:complete len:716 (+),score=64.18 gb/GECG01012632.1/:1-2148(+)